MYRSRGRGNRNIRQYKNHLAANYFRECSKTINDKPDFKRFYVWRESNHKLGNNTFIKTDQQHPEGHPRFWIGKHLAYTYTPLLPTL